ncbi:hypothetical protein HYU50_02140 [Candidatus Woesearchaeota archaeon]|nr:hypothetical protein [Candidatus Woesearchaeota archaeon]
MRHISLIIYAIFLLTISACSYAPTANLIKEEKVVYEDDIDVKAYFCPRENCTSILENAINNAKSSLHCAFYDIDSDRIIKAIVKKSRDADVKIVIDKNNYQNQIRGLGIRIADSKQYMHNKFCIIDNKIVLTGSTNPTNNDLTLNNNNIVVIASRYIAENYEDEFNELWNGILAAGNNVKYDKINSNDVLLENYFCPEDDCKRKVIEALKNAKQSIYFMTFSFTDEDIADAALMSDLDIKGVFETMQAGSQYSQFQRLKDFNIDVKKDKNKKNMHHKVFIIDNETIITGSYNPTGSGNYRNDENLIVIRNKDIAKGFVEEFELLRQ